MQRMNELMKLCNKFMLRRTSTVLKELLPTKVEQVRTHITMCVLLALALDRCGTASTRWQDDNSLSCHLDGVCVTMRTLALAS